MEVFGKGPWRIAVIESDSFMGQKVDHYRRFETEVAAKLWMIDYNSNNDKDVVPEWYMYAQFPQYIL